MGRQISYRRLEAADERQYMLNDAYEVYEKVGRPVGAEKFHCHDFYEVIYVCEGEYAGVVDDRTYYLKKGDFLLIDRNIMHKYHYVEKRHDSSKRIILWISEDMLILLAGGKDDLTKCFKKAGSAAACHFPVYYEEMLRSYLFKLAQENVVDVEMEGAKEILDKSYLALFFVYVNELCMKERFTTIVENTFYSDMVRSVASYIEENISKKLTLDELAEYIHMSKYHFLRCFKEETGMTVHEFINNKRLMKAMEMLKNNCPLSDTWQESGFNDYTTFLRNFKKVFGVSPGSVSKV